MKSLGRNSRNKQSLTRSTRLSPHFTLARFLYSKTAIEKKIDNVPTKNAVKRLQKLAAHLEEVVALLGYPIRISSAYRCRALNAAVGGSKTSQHLQGLAADFVCTRFGSPYQICRKIAKSDIAFDQLILEFGASPGTEWVHIGFGRKKRRQVLTICACDGFYHQGLHRYKKSRTNLRPNMIPAVTKRGPLLSYTN